MDSETGSDTVTVTVNDLPLQVQNKVRCPVCRGDQFVNNGLHDGIRYYRCRICADPETQEPTTFQVIVKDPLRVERYVEGMRPQKTSCMDEYVYVIQPDPADS